MERQHCGGQQHQQNQKDFQQSFQKAVLFWLSVMLLDLTPLNGLPPVVLFFLVFVIVCFLLCQIGFLLPKGLVGKVVILKRALLRLGLLRERVVLPTLRGIVILHGSGRPLRLPWPLVFHKLTAFCYILHHFNRVVNRGRKSLQKNIRVDGKLLLTNQDFDCMMVQNTRYCVT